MPVILAGMPTERQALTRKMETPVQEAKAEYVETLRGALGFHSRVNPALRTCMRWIHGYPISLSLPSCDPSCVFKDRPTVYWDFTIGLREGGRS